MKDILKWSQKIAAIAKTGMHFASSHEDRYHLERYEQLLEIASEMQAAIAGRDISDVRIVLSKDDGYITPKVDVRAGVFVDGKILLVREMCDGRWTVPGGWADVGQRPGEAVAAEILQEAGYYAKVSKLVAVHDQHLRNTPHCFHSYKLIFLCEITGRGERSETETDAVEFFGESELPPLSEGRINAEQIALLFAHHRDPSLPTVVD